MARTKHDPWAPAVAHLRSADARLASLIDRVGPCALRPRPPRDRFPTLVRSIISQQISTKAAISIDARLRTVTGADHAPQVLLRFDEAALRTAGLSGQKAQYILNLSEAVSEGRVRLTRLHGLDDETIIEQLTSVKGIGRWTAEMFLVFALNRPDILSATDLGIRNGLRDHFGLDDAPKPAHCHTLTEPWRPYRSVAMWYLWRKNDTREGVDRVRENP